MCCFFVYESLKIDNKKEDNKIKKKKKIKITRKN